MESQKTNALKFGTLSRNNVTTQRLLNMLQANMPTLARILPILGYQDPGHSNSDSFGSLAKNQKSQMIANLVRQLQ